ncbi:MAG: hypothetical protein ACRETX_15680, partial [Steroidobacteraceae bacterium]
MVVLSIADALRLVRRGVLAAAALAASQFVLTSDARANPWLAPGDLGLRHDVQLLADAGVIRAPATTWPMSWPDIARDVLSAEPTEHHSRAVEDALGRVRRAARREATPGFAGSSIGVSGAQEPASLRTFSDTPREEAELAIGASWLGDRLAANIEVAVVSNAQDDRDVRLDGSYIGVTFGNFMVST